MVDTVVNVLQTEDRTWQDICAQLGGSEDATDRSTLARYRVKEAITDLKALHRAIAKDNPIGDCKDIGTKPDLSQAQACLDRMIETLNETTEKSEKLVAIVRNALKGGPGTVLALARELDFSRVVLIRMAEVAQVSEQAIDDVTSSFGRLAGVIRVPLKLVVAEALVRINELVLVAIEQRGLIAPTDTARNSCQLLRQGSYKTTVQTRLLRRTVLRFEAPPTDSTCDATSSACAMTSTPRGKTVRDLCDEIDKPGQNHCRRALRRMGVRRDEIAETLDPTHLLRKQPDDSDTIPDAVDDQATAIQQAAEYCHSHDPTLRCIGDVAGILIYAPTTVNEVNVSFTDAGIVALGEQLTGIRRALDAIDELTRHDAGQAAEHFRILYGQVHAVGTEVSGRLTEKVEVALSPRCKQKAEKVEKNRIGHMQALADRLKISLATVTCEKPRTADREQVDSVVDGVEVMFDREAMCNPFTQSYLSFAVRDGSMFGSCSCSLTAGSQGEKLARAVADLAKASNLKLIEEIIIIGHSDSTNINSPCGECENVRQNDELSKKRAEAFAVAVKDSLGEGLRPKVRTEGVGSMRPVNDKPCLTDDAACHAKNRRIEVQMKLKDGVLEPRDCM